MYLGSKYLCLDCGEVYDSSYLKFSEFTDELICPKTNCCGSLIEVDELMIPTIKILNNKGYFTKYCCSGHYSGQLGKAYILFHEGIDIPNVPTGFEKEIFQGCVYLGSIDDMVEPTYEDFYKICDNAKELLKWAIGLPDINE